MNSKPDKWLDRRTEHDFNAEIVTDTTTWNEKREKLFSPHEK